MLIPVLHGIHSLGFIGCWVGFGGWWKQTWKTAHKTHAYTWTMD